MQETLSRLGVSMPDKAQYYSDVIMGAMASQITVVTIVYSNVRSGVDQRKHRSSASLAFLRAIPRTKGQ